MANVEAVVPSAQPIRVMIVDDHHVVREGLMSLLQTEPNIIVSAQASDASDALDVFSRDPCDVALIDLRLGKDSGLDVIRAFVNHSPTTRVVVLTNYGDQMHVHRALSAGAVAVVVKDADPGEIIRAIRDANEGRCYLSATASASLAEHIHNTPLTEREQQVLELLVRGTRNRMIARRLGIGVETVKTHIRSILVKLRASDRTAATATAIKRGLVDIE